MSDFEIPVTLVINVRHGGFSLSPVAARALAARKGLTLYAPIPGEAYLHVEGTDEPIDRAVKRNDPDLIAVVRELGAAANGDCADLRIVTVPVHVGTEDHAGREEVTVYGGAYVTEPRG